ncbi:MAG TPA: DEAD/DEAH box helicase [Chloroflexota bacterium]|nr:DEAD/DEAH box helicase [Chloroflexota bacterium]
MVDALRRLDPEALEALLGITLDPFQREAIESLAAGRSVLVAAPTGTGKTAIAEYAVLDAIGRGGRALYTTPIKALSNQKFRDFQVLLERSATRGLIGPSQDVGLLTGDIVVNPDGRLLVMTTEVVRNMLVQGRPLPEQAAVLVFDEVHYMGDPERGTAWEEAILLSPSGLPLVCLSATVPNADEVAAWIRSTHGELDCVLYGHRAVPLEHRYFLDGRAHLVLDADGRRRADFKGVGGELSRAIQRPGSWGRDGPTREAPDSAARKAAEPRRQPQPWEVLRLLEGEQLTPAIYFLFGRRACEQAAESCLALKPVRAAEQLVNEARLRLSDLPPEDRALRQVAWLFRLLPRGVAVHHAGLLPVVKMLVEELFGSGRLRAVFATDTLALGINMPARTVVVGEMSKWDGQQHRLLTPNEYRQLTGRAGRRGIDERGVSVILYSPWVSFEQSIAVATGDLLPLESAFSPNYSTALNLWRQPGDQKRLADLYARSFRRFQQQARLANLADEHAELKERFEEITDEGAADPNTWQLARELADSERTLAGADRQATLEAYAMVEGLGRVLERFGYLSVEQPTHKASVLRRIFDTNALTLAELLTSRRLEALDAAEIAEVCSWFAFDRDTPIRGLSLTTRLYRLHEEVLGLHFRVLEEERRAGVTVSRPLSEDLRGVALAWAQGRTLGEIARLSRLAEGDLVGLLQKTIDILSQLRAGLERADVPPRRADRLDVGGLVPRFAEADRLVRRGVIETSYRWALSGPPPADAAAADWPIPTVEDASPPRRSRRDLPHRRLSRQRRRGP